MQSNCVYTIIYNYIELIQSNAVLISYRKVAVKISEKETFICNFPQIVTDYFKRIWGFEVFSFWCKFKPFWGFNACSYSEVISLSFWQVMFWGQYWYHLKEDFLSFPMMCSNLYFSLPWIFAIFLIAYLKSVQLIMWGK